MDSTKKKKKNVISISFFNSFIKPNEQNEYIVDEEVLFCIK